MILIGSLLKSRTYVAYRCFNAKLVASARILIIIVRLIKIVFRTLPDKVKFKLLQKLQYYKKQKKSRKIEVYIIDNVISYKKYDSRTLSKK